MCLIVPAGQWNLVPITSALRQHHPRWSISAVWCGDPHLRPTLPTSLAIEWCDVDLAEPTGAGWGRLITALPARLYEWCRAAVAVERLLDRADESVVVLRVGSVAVLGDCSSMVSADVATLISRSSSVLPSDGLAPTEGDLIERGEHCTVAAAFRPGAQGALVWLYQQLGCAAGEVGPWLDRMGRMFGAGHCVDERIGAGPWRAPTAIAPTLVDIDLIDRDQPWFFSFDGAPTRMRLSDDSVLAAAVQSATAQIEGAEAPIKLPGGIAVDHAMRTLMRAAILAWRQGVAQLPPEPFSTHNAAFMRWLESPEPGGADIGRYWLAVRDQRPDLQAAFPHARSVDAARFAEWADASWRLEGRSALLASGVGACNAIKSIGFDSAGVNVLGYIDFDQSQGHIARELVAAFGAAGVGVSALNHNRSLGARRSDEAATPREARFATNIVVVNADQFEFVVSDHGATLLDGRYTIGYWFWELEHIPATMLPAIDHVDEIWTGSQFVADAFSRVTDKPVRCVPLPVAQPQPSQRTRASFGLPNDRFVFLATFDQFSVPERKNPFGVIEAFTRAFADGEGPLLWIKTLNGDKGWQQHERLLLAASGRSDIIVRDEHLSRPDQMAVLQVADCLVSLHRSEGLGLHCAEAMWLRKPVIATRYSGNLDFMDDSCAAMVDYELVPVRHGQGIYPPEAMWAEPDVEQAAAHMRALASDSALCSRLGASARERMASQASQAETGRMMVELATRRFTKGSI